MKMIFPATLRVVLPKGSLILIQSGRQGRRFLAADTAVDVEVDVQSLAGLCRRACGNRTRKARVGPLDAAPLSDVVFEEDVPPSPSDVSR
jgi:hypothetical protein